MAPGEGYDILLDALRRRPGWMSDAACRGLPTEAFFPPPGYRGHLERSRGAEGLAVCSSCPVAGPCAAYASEEGLEGIYGATTTAERRTIRRRGAA